MHSRGFTLLELSITVLIFAIVAAGVIEGQTATANYAALGRAEDSLSLEAGSIFDEMSTDLASSGWWFESDSTDYLDKTRDRSLRYMPFAQIQATTSTLTSSLGTAFDYTHRPATNGLSFPDVPASLDAFLPGTVADRTSLFTSSTTAGPTATERSAWASSFYARSQELLFLKSSIGLWDEVHDKLASGRDETPSLQFTGPASDWVPPTITAATPSATLDAEDTKRARLRILYPSGWFPVYDSTGNITRFDPRTLWHYDTNPTTGVKLSGTYSTSQFIPYGAVMETGLVNIANELSDIRVNWRTIDGGAFGASDITRDSIRVYEYAVVKSPVGLGRLVRAVRVLKANVSSPVTGVEVGQYLPSSAADTSLMQVEKVLSDNVVRAIFDTYRTVDEGTDALGQPIGKVTSLELNHVRVRLFMARSTNLASEGILTRVIDRTLTMRSQNSSVDRGEAENQPATSIASSLGTVPIGIDF